MHKTGNHGMRDSVGLNVPRYTQQVILETSVTTQLIAPVLTTKNTDEHI